MLYATPPLQPDEQRALARIELLRDTLRSRVREPRRWTASLRRVQFARGVQGSNSIEGYDAKLDDAMAIDLGEQPLDAGTETALAIKGYRDAMTYVLQLAGETDVVYSDQLLKSLHFMMTGYDLTKRPGRWRSRSVYVQEESSGRTVYEGPDVDLVPGLMNELTVGLAADTETPTLVKAAMAHLNLVMVHPFADGNGRMARCLQTMVLARDGILSPVFSSIEEYLGRNTPSYYEVLAEVGQGSWHPRNDTRPWVRYALTAHFRQATTLLRRTTEVERLYHELDAIVARHHLPERTVDALFDAASGRRVRNSVYRALIEDQTGGSVHEQTASRDLRTLVQLGLLEPQGEKRGRYYTMGPALGPVIDKVRRDRPARDDSDPFALTAEDSGQQSLFE